MPHKEPMAKALMSDEGRVGKLNSVSITEIDLIISLNRDQGAGVFKHWRKINGNLNFFKHILF